MKPHDECPSTDDFIRPGLRKWIPACWALVAGVFAVHAAVRFGGLWNPIGYPLSMAVVWPLPWLLVTRAGRRKMGFRRPRSVGWLVLGPAAALGVLAVAAALSWALFGSGDANWFARHAMFLRDALAGAPPDVSTQARFWIATLPAMVFSPLAEEFLYRGFFPAALAPLVGGRFANTLQATAFALVHLAHYGLAPWQPLLIVAWLPSMFAAGWLFGWMARRSGSLWIAILSHSVFNLSMNGLVFLWFADLVAR